VKLGAVFESGYYTLMKEQTSNSSVRRK